MIFTLEALNAGEGDCLLLIYGEPGSPRLIVIDGGPQQTCAEALMPRLLELREVFGARTLPVELLVVTHVDSDHIAGVLALTRALREVSPGAAPPAAIKELWHNSFDDVVRTDEVDQALAFVDALPFAGGVASVGEGRTLRADAARLGIAVNAEFDPLVVRPDDAGVVIPCGDGLTLTVLGPARAQLAAFQKEWDAALAAAKQRRGGVAGASLDTSKPNLASITLLAECEGRTMLLAGDARGDHLVAGLEAAKLLPEGGTMHVDVFKLPHHGSCRNVTLELLRRVTADTYVISANGKHGNPDRETLERLEEARAGARYRVVCTFPEAAYRSVRADEAGADERREALQAFHTWAKRQPDTVEFVHREASALGVKVELGSPLGRVRR